MAAEDKPLGSVTADRAAVEERWQPSLDRSANGLRLSETLEEEAR